MDRGRDGRVKEKLGDISPGCRRHLLIPYYPVDRGRGGRVKEKLGDMTLDCRRHLLIPYYLVDIYLT